jgi:hypothetical protein
LMESSHVPLAPFVPVGQPPPPPTPSTPGPSGIFVCSSDAMPLNLTPHHSHNNGHNSSAANISVGPLNTNIPQSSTPSTLTNDTTCGSCNRPQQSPPPQNSNTQRLMGMSNMYTPNPQPTGAPIPSAAHHVSAEVLVDPNGTFQSEVIIHSTPDASHSHLHHHVHQHHYHPPTHPARLHFGVSPPGFHISISPAGMVPPVNQLFIYSKNTISDCFSIKSLMAAVRLRCMHPFRLQWLTSIRAITISDLFCRDT